MTASAAMMSLGWMVSCWRIAAATWWRGVSGAEEKDGVGERRRRPVRREEEKGVAEVGMRVGGSSGSVVGGEVRGREGDGFAGDEVTGGGWGLRRRCGGDGGLR